MAKGAAFVWETRLERLLHRALVLNEIGREETAYRLNWVGTAESGFSFGFARFDLAAGPGEAREAFLAILRDRGSDDNLLAGLLPTLESVIAKPVGEMSDQELNLVNYNKRRINAALGSLAGRRVIDRLHLDHIRMLQHQVGPLGDIANEQARDFVQSLEGRVYMADYCSQFGEPTTLRGFIRGEVVTFGGSDHRLAETLTREVWRRFVMSTRYAQKYPNEIRRRLRNIARVVREDDLAD